MDSDDESYQNLDLLKIIKNAAKPSSFQINTTSKAAPNEVSSTVLPHHVASGAMSPVELPLTEAVQLPTSKRTGKGSYRLPGEYDSPPAPEEIKETSVTPERHPPKPKPKPAGILSLHQNMESVTKNISTMNIPRQASSSSDSDLAKRLVIAIDYGTTFTGVALTLVPQNEKRAKLDGIYVISDWGKDMSNTRKVPSAYSYTPANTGEEQWGGSMSSDATVMVHTKLELDEQARKSDELDIILHNLDGMNNLDFEHIERTNGNPAFSPKKPDDIVKDYLDKVFQRVMRVLETDERFRIEDVDRRKMPVDIVFTMPVNWSYRAKNATYRAITQAGFNNVTFPRLRDILILSEPEAAAVYTARYLKEKKAAEKLLKEDECFIICDAGGGTVDVVTFRVTSLDPVLQIEKVGPGNSGKCGSVFIDGEFKKWLRESIIGKEAYELLEPNTNGRIKAHSTTSEGMRAIIQQFTREKKRFTGKESDSEVFGIDLPTQLKDVENEAVEEGELMMVREEMEFFFNKPLNQIVSLILEQKRFAEAYDRRIKNVFMIGGFGESKYLQERLAAAMAPWFIKVYQPDTSWTAVVLGAAMHGIEKASLNHIRTGCSPNNYGLAFDTEQVKGADDDEHQFVSEVTGKIMGRDRMIWIIRRGDLILLSSAESPETLLKFAFNEKGKKDFVIPIYQYLDDDDDNLPTRLKGAAKEMRKIFEIPVSLEGKDLASFHMYPGPQEPYYQAIVSLKVIWVDGVLHPEVRCNQEVLYPNPGISEPSPTRSSPDNTIMQRKDSKVSRVTL